MFVGTCHPDPFRRRHETATTLDKYPSGGMLLHNAEIVAFDVSSESPRLEARALDVLRCISGRTSL